MSEWGRVNFLSQRFIWLKLFFCLNRFCTTYSTNLNSDRKSFKWMTHCNSECFK